jgi:hypothetical protein
VPCGSVEIADSLDATRSDIVHIHFHFLSGFSFVRMVKFKNVVAYQLYGGYFSSVCGLLLTRSLLGKSIFTRAVFKHQTSNYLGTRVEIKTAHHRTKYWCLIIGPPVQLQKCLRVNIKSAKKWEEPLKRLKQCLARRCSRPAFSHRDSIHRSAFCASSR